MSSLRNSDTLCQYLGPPVWYWLLNVCENVAICTALMGRWPLGQILFGPWNILHMLYMMSVFIMIGMSAYGTRSGELIMKRKICMKSMTFFFPNEMQLRQRGPDSQVMRCEFSEFKKYSSGRHFWEAVVTVVVTDSAKNGTTSMKTWWLDITTW